MELATPNQEDFFAFIDDFSYNSTQKIMENINSSKREIGYIINSYVFRVPLDMVRRRTQQIDNLHTWLHEKIDKRFLKNQNQLNLLSKNIESYEVERTLKRGFVLVQQNSNYITRAAKFKNTNQAELIFHDDKVEVNNKI